MRIVLLFLLLFVLTTKAFSDTKSLSVDRVVNDDITVIFPNDDDIKPDSSDFSIVNYILMSNDEGERWVVVTLKNTSSGSRIFSHQMLLALFANGDRKFPLPYKHRFDEKEIVSLTLSFGVNKFPIIDLVTNEE